MATETKYNIVVDSIPEDEPIILFRAQDNKLLGLLQVYYHECEKDGSPESFLNTLSQKIREIILWQQDNSDKVKIPD